MARTPRFGASLLLLALAACDRSSTPTATEVAAPSLSASSFQDKVGADVWAALARGERPLVVVALTDVSDPDLAVKRRAVAAAQDAALRGIRDDELRVRRRFQAVPAFSAEAFNRGALVRLAANPLVTRIDLDVGGTGTLARAVPFIRADARHADGNQGAGVTVAILDSGIDSDHPALAGALVGEACFGFRQAVFGGNFCLGGVDRLTGAGSAEDDAGHGTHVTGIVASRGGTFDIPPFGRFQLAPGVAPAASIVAIKVLDNCSLAGCFYSASEVVAALDYIAVTPALGVDVVNMSLGTGLLFTGACDATFAWTQAGAAAVANLRAAGITVFASSGNNGSNFQMPFPACLSDVISVGSVTLLDQINTFSNHAPNTDILAPGSQISSLALNGIIVSLSGTSMASPMAAGCAALLIESGDATTPATIEARLKTSPIALTRAGTTLPRIVCGPPSAAPSVTVTSATVTVDEGSTAVNGGTFLDPEGDAVTMSASIGTVTTGSGTWSWSLGTTDGPAQSQTVTITADDKLGGVTTETFVLTVNNVAPTVDAGADVTIASNTSFAFLGRFSDPGVNDSPWGWSIAWGVGSPTTGSTNTQAAITDSRTYCVPGDYLVTLGVTDRDGATGSDSRTVTVMALAVGIDIQPGSSPNSVNLGRGGVLPVAVLGSDTFDVRTLDPATIVLGDGSGTDTPVAQRGKGRYLTTLQDVNGDGLLDLVLQFEVPTLVANGDLTLVTTQLTLRGVLSNGCSHVSGTQDVRVVP